MVNVDNNHEIILKNSQCKRHDFIDVAKGIGILFVIFAHVNYTPSLLTIVYSFHMPLFFILSGMLFNPDRYSNFKAFIKRKFQTLICPYILFYLLSILFRLVVSILANRGNININDFVVYFSQMFLSQGSGKLPNAPLWFVTCLMVVEIIYYFIAKLKKPLIIIVSIPLTFSGWIIESDYIPFKNELLPWSIDSALFAIGFFAIGHLLFDYICKIVGKFRASHNKNVIYITVFILAVSVLIPLALHNGKVSLGSKILNNGFLLYLTGVLGSVAVLSMSGLFEKNKFLMYCGRNSFQIMAVHYLIRDFVRLVYSFFDIPLYDKTNFVETILPVIAVTCLSLFFTVFYNKIKYVIKEFCGKSI